MKKSSWNSDLIQSCVLETKVKISQSAELLSEMNVDFGHLVKGAGCAVALPQTPAELEALVNFANKHHLPMTLRGKGLSQNGQAVPSNHELAIDFSNLQKIDEINISAESIRCESGVTWKGLVEKTIPYGYIPPVLPLNLNLSIAGTLSIGGIGAASHLYGPAVDHVKSLEVIAGSGAFTICNESAESDLFYSVLAGLGRCGAMSAVTLALRKCRPHVRTFYLLYTDKEAWLNDQKYLCEHKHGDYLEAFCSASMQGLRNTDHGRKPFAEWFYPLHLSFEYDTEAPDQNTVLQNLHYWKLTHIEDNSMLDYVNRYEPRFALMHKSGAWELPHPWTECLISYDKINYLLPQLLAEIPLGIGDGHRVLFVANTKNKNSLFMYPDNSHSYAAVFAILPVGIPLYAVADTLQALRRVHDIMIDAHGKRYLSGWLGTCDESMWRQHYGELYERWAQNKITYDKNEILSSYLFP